MTEELVRQDAQALSPSPVFRGEHMVRALADYRALQKALDEAMPDQLMTIQGKSFRKKGYWRAISVAFGLTVEPVEHSEQRTVVGTLPSGGDDYMYAVTYRAVAPNGRSATGDGACAASEKQKGRMEASEHNVRSHAATRAFNRAVSNLVGFGEVSAEEVERDEHAAAPTVRPDGITRIAAVEEKSGTGKGGKTWTRYLITTEDGRGGSTFEKGLAEQAQKFLAAQAPCVPTFVKSGDYVNFTGLESVTATQAGSPTSVPTSGEAPPSGTGEGVITGPQVKRAWAIARGSGWDEAGVKALLAAAGVESMAQVPVGAYETLVQTLKAGPTKGTGA